MDSGAGVSDGASGQLWFISYARPDRAWAEWVAWQLLDDGYQVELDYWDWGPRDNFVLKMNAALERGRLLALFSPAYFEQERFTTLEWTAVLAMKEKITSVRVAETVLPPILRSFTPADLFGQGEQEACRVLLDAVNGPVRPTTPPGFPETGFGTGGAGVLRSLGDSGPRLPGSLPRVWNLPARNAAFTGRDNLLIRLRQALAVDQRVAVQALRGRGGIGKTQLAIEYAHRFAGEYELSWWIPAEKPALIPHYLAQLADRIGAAPAETPPDRAVDLLLEELRTSARWLLIFDNAEDPARLAPFLPGGTNGHVLITSRNPNWYTLATPIDITILTRTESLTLLRARGATVDDDTGERIADALDDLPLALVQAASLLTSGFSADLLESELARSIATAMAEGQPDTYPASLAAQIELTISRLKADNPGAAALLNALALLAPEPFPLITCAGHLPDVASTPLKDTLGTPTATVRALDAIARHSLARVQEGTLQLHRLTQAVLADRLAPDQREQAQRDTETLLTAADPGDAKEPPSWPAWQVLVPHALAVAPEHLTTSAGRRTAAGACWYLMERAQPLPARDYLQELYDTWAPQLGPDHEDTLYIAHDLARAYRNTGDYEKALALDEDAYQRHRQLRGDDYVRTLFSAVSLASDLNALQRDEEALALAQDTFDRRQRLLGKDDPETLRTAINLVNYLDSADRIDEAVALGEDTLERLRRVRGKDHPDTLLMAGNLADHLASVGRVDEALALGEDTLERLRRVRGEDHPDTLLMAGNLAFDLASVGRVDEALALGEDTLERLRRVRGEDHPDTLRIAGNLAFDLASVGRVDEALALGEDTLERLRRVRGEDHPDTLLMAGNLAFDLASVGRVDEALALGEDTLERLRRVGGWDDPDTLAIAQFVDSLRREQIGSDAGE
jgi:tetratricopeptide (TPR) repeat protein